MGHKIRTKWLKQMLKVLKETWIHPCSSVTSFLDLSANVCVWTVQVQIQILWSGRSSGPAQKEFEAVLSMSTDPRRYPQLVPVSAASYRLTSWPEWIAGSMSFLLSQAAGVPAVTHGTGLGRVEAALFSLGRMDTNLWQLKWELSPIVQQWQASKWKTAQVFLSKAPEILWKSRAASGSAESPILLRSLGTLSMPGKGLGAGSQDEQAEGMPCFYTFSQ